MRQDMIVKYICFDRYPQSCELIMAKNVILASVPCFNFIYLGTNNHNFLFRWSNLRKFKEH